MKKLRPAAAFLLVLILVFSSASPAFAKDLEPCYHCGSTGRFECPNCHNQVQITCDGCNGAGGSKCDGEEGKGPCDNGYYTCPSCHGDTYIRNGDGEIPKDAVPGSCGTCGGKGKLECWHCHGAYWIVCNRCGGSGEVECQNENCKESRKIGWKCHYCMGTGYLLTNFWPGENDGVQNKPEKGDKIWVNGKSSTYGESGSGNGSGGSGGSNGSGNGSGGGNSSQGGNSGSSASTTPRYDSSGSNIARDPSNGRDFIWFVDTGSGTWEFGGRTFTLTRGGKTVSGIIDLKFNENIFIVPDTGDTDGLGGIHAYLTGSGGFKVELERSGDGGIAVGRHTPSGQYIPFNVSLVLEYSAAEDNTLYTIDLAGGHWDVGGRDVTATINGQPAAGIVRISQWEPIKFHGIDRDTMKVCLRGENDFRVELELSGSDEASVGRYSPADAVLPPEGLYISIEHTGAAGPGGEDLVHTVDFAGGHWDVDGKDVTAYIDGLRAEGIRELTENDNIKLNGFDRDTMKVRVYANDGFSAGLEVNGDDEARLGLCDDPEAVLPPALYFVIEQRDDISDDNRTFEIDFGSGSWDIEGAGRPVVAWIDGHTAQGVVEIRGTDRIFLEDFDGGFMQVRVYADDGFSVILNHTGDNEVFLDSYLGDADGLPEKLHFVIEQIDEDNKTYSIAIKGCYVAQSSILWKELRNIANNLEIRVMMLDDEAEVLFEIPSHYGSIRIYNITEASEMQLLGTFKDPKYYNPKYLNVFVQDSNGTVAELIPDANNVVCLARRAPADVELSGELALYFAPAPGYENEIRRFTDAPFYIYDYYREMSVTTSGDISKISGFDIVTDRMGSEEALAFQKYTEEELESLGAVIESIVCTGRPAEITNALKMKLNKIAKENGVNATRKGQFFPIQFDGHVDLDFPVRVNVHLEPGVLDGSRPIYMYHITDKGVVEYLDVAEVILREDGSVETLSFYTKSFSDFFASDTQLTKGLGIEDPEYAAQFAWNRVDNADTKKEITNILLMIGAAILVGGIGSFILARKKPKNGKKIQKR